MMHTTDASYGMIGFHWFFQFFIFFLFMLIVWWLLRNMSGFGFQTHTRETAEEILKKRLAKGDVSQEEYRKLKRELE